ncbi:hypothetical protein RQP46_001044 [Phenoliferia psychrophenolica]
MTVFTERYGVGGTRTGQSWLYLAGDPIVPLGPNIASQDDWWFRGPAFRALAPPAGAVTALPAGSTITIEISCHIAWTSFGWSTSTPGSPLDACPGNTGAYHSGPDTSVVDPNYLSGCALAIADVTDIEDVTMENLAVFSVQPSCVLTKETQFDIPRLMPKCTGPKCMTAFDCNVTNVHSDATAIAAPKDPSWSFSPGAQNDIFVGSTTSPNTVATSITSVKATASAAPTRKPLVAVSLSIGLPANRVANYYSALATRIGGAERFIKNKKVPTRRQAGHKARHAHHSDPMYL